MVDKTENPGGDPVPTERVETGLAPVTRAFGTGLLKEAVKQNQKNLQDQVVASVQQMLETLQLQQDMQRQCASNIDVLQRKVDAIEAGAFTLDNYGTIVFTDTLLNEEAIITECCRHCGAPVDGLGQKKAAPRYRPVGR